VVEERFDAVTPETEGQVIVASILESALIPAPLVETLFVSSIAPPVAVVVTELVAVAELCKARLFRKTIVGMGKPERTPEPEGAHAHCAGNCGLGRHLLEIHRFNSSVILTWLRQGLLTAQLDPGAGAASWLESIRRTAQRGLLSLLRNDFRLLRRTRTSMDDHENCVMEKMWRSRGDRWAQSLDDPAP
jgi:hypothetical protein